jgi:hypothetical protein
MGRPRACCRYVALFFIIVLVSCQNISVSEEQLEKLQLEKANRQIKRISEADIFDEVRKRGQIIATRLPADKESINANFDIKMYPYSDSTYSLDNSEINKLFSAFSYSFENQIVTGEHVQELRDGTLIYAISTDKGMLVIFFDKKSLIISMH